MEKTVDFNKAFVVRKGSDEKWFITIGDQLATMQQFESKEEAKAHVEAVDWNLVAVLIHSMFNQLNKKDNE